MTDVVYFAMMLDLGREYMEKAFPEIVKEKDQKRAEEREMRARCLA